MTIKILAVDSDADVRRLLEIRLKKAGYQVILTGNGSEAAQLAQTEAPEVVITRVRLPGLDGLALTRRLKAQPNPPLIILLTMLNSDRDIAAGFAAGADDYMTKPFSPLVLLERLRVNLIRTGRTAPAIPAESEAVDE
jgi:DNA-binding response OmpR family regulator